MSRRDRRFQRQFEALERAFPALRGILAVLRRKGWWIVRLPLALVFIVGGIFSFLPIFGIWMLPIGLLLLAVDLPGLRGPISGLVIQARHRIGKWRRRWRSGKRP